MERKEPLLQKERRITDQEIVAELSRLADTRHVVVSERDREA